MLNQRVKSPTE